MAQITTTSIEVPRRDPISSNGIITRTWETFFRTIKTYLDPLGIEKSAQLENNQAAATDIVGLSFSKATVSQSVVEYVIQRITTGGSAVELLQTGTFHAVYKPTSDSWSLVTIGTPGPHTSGITFSITADGQVQYTSTNVAGTASISRIIYRARTLGGKSFQYSTMGT